MAETIEALEPTLRAILRTQITDEHGVVKNLRQEAEMTIAQLIDTGTLATDEDVEEGGGDVTIDTDPTLAADSDEVVPSQKAIKAYADALLEASDAMIFKGDIDCTEEPNYPAADTGDTYRVSANGKIGGASGITVTTGAILICIADNSISGNQATVGSNWSIIQVLSGTPLISGGALGTPSSGNLVDCTGYLVDNVVDIDAGVLAALKLPLDSPGGLAKIPDS